MCPTYARYYFFEIVDFFGYCEAASYGYISKTGLDFPNNLLLKAVDKIPIPESGIKSAMEFSLYSHYPLYGSLIVIEIFSRIL